MRTRRLRSLAIVLVLTGACTSTSTVLWHGTPYPALVDCSVRYAESSGETLPVIPEEIRSRALARASKWAFDSCCSPCSYPMCAAFIGYSEGKLTVYVTSDEWNLLEANPGFIVLKPEAEIELSTEDFRVLRVTAWHSGCRWGQVGCKWPARFE